MTIQGEISSTYHIVTYISFVSILVRLKHPRIVLSTFICSIFGAAANHSPAKPRRIFDFFEFFCFGSTSSFLYVLPDKLPLIDIHISCTQCVSILEWRR